MNFKHDLLLIDLEMTGLEISKHEIIQIASVLLDKQTLEEKQSFMTYVKPKKWANRDPESMKINGIKKETLETAPSLKEALLEFRNINSKPVILTVWGGTLDTIFLKAGYEKCKMEYPYDYHVFNVWSFAYPLLAKKNMLKSNNRFAGFSMDELVKKFRIKQNGKRHDALTDCRLEADVLRHLIKQV